MALNSYYGYQPTYYPTYQTQMAAPAQNAQPQSNGILWVQGETGAKSYLVAPGQSVMLMDSETNRFYIKSSDNSGMPLPLRIFDYTEKRENNIAEPKVSEGQSLSEYVTKAELEERLAEIKREKESKDDA